MDQLQLQFDQLLVNGHFMLKVVGVLFVIQVLNWLLGYRLNYLGNYPRHLRGLPGIVISPFLHGNFQHFFMNAIPLLALGAFAMQSGRLYFYYLIATIILVSGSLLWLFGRRAIHIGASGVIMGLFSFLLYNAYYHPSATAIILALVTIYYFAGLFLGLFPEDETTSWEGHVFGFISGIVAIYLI
jgi:membrane associated rhomboid family serine protease